MTVSLRDGPTLASLKLRIRQREKLERKTAGQISRRIRAQHQKHCGHLRVLIRRYSVTHWDCWVIPITKAVQRDLLKGSAL